MVVLCLCHSSVDNIIGELTFKAQTRLLISIYLENYTEKLNPEVIMNANYSRPPGYQHEHKCHNSI